jgi:trans-aconitate 2-methyltransferase
MRQADNDWEPNLYLRFQGERTQPTIDLVNRIELRDPARIIDLGCGPGNSTAVLVGRWPRAQVTGIDTSPAMIRDARQRMPQLDWRVGRAEDAGLLGTFDLVFGNAVIHWIPGQEKLLAGLVAAVSPGGVLALQVPLSSEMPIAGVIDQCYARLQLDNAFRIENHLHYHSVETYFEIIGTLAEKFCLWVTSYYHVLDSSAAIYEMMKSTRLRPYLASIEDERKRREFKDSLIREIALAYRPQKNGKVLFPFKRLFMTICKDA